MLLDLVLTINEGLVEYVKVGDSLGCSDHGGDQNSAWRKQDSK